MWLPPDGACCLAGDRQWGVGSMQHDLSDAVAWAVKTGIADPKKVCIMGSSYGGYATFAGECCAANAHSPNEYIHICNATLPWTADTHSRMRLHFLCTALVVAPGSHSVTPQSSR
jgi:hypothetical protein